MAPTDANARAPDRAGPFYRRIIAWLAGFEDGQIMRVAFFILLFGTLSVLYVDYRELTSADALLGAPAQPVLPPFNPDSPDDGPHPQVTTPTATLDAPMTIALASGGILALTGTIDIGAADRFAAEVAAHGEYADTVGLDSPGGSVMDALAIGALIQEKGFATAVAAGSLCASSCPIIFAAGKQRLASDKAAIGVHQIYAASISADPAQLAKTAGLAMSDAQSMTAQITRFLSSAGVDPALWLHALETPPDHLYYLTPKEMEALKLATKITH
ncbi:hypothetical protein [Devosia sp.]|uniref:COG3904 family protein n=1 Tax=Devosia sp. TaxID=1871048 RepID=UPI0032651377